MWARSGALLALSTGRGARPQWSQVGLQLSDLPGEHAALNLIVRHSDRPNVLTVAELDLAGARALGEALSSTLVSGAPSVVHCTLPSGAWSAVSVMRFKPYAKADLPDELTFTIHHHEDSTFNGATLPAIMVVRQFVPLLEAAIATATRRELTAVPEPSATVVSQPRLAA